MCSAPSFTDLYTYVEGMKGSGWVRNSDIYSLYANGEWNDKEIVRLYVSGGSNVMIHGLMALNTIPFGAAKRGDDPYWRAKVGNIPESDSKFEGNFHGANVFSNPMYNGGSAMKLGQNIFVGENVWGNDNMLFILQHEYGHYLQFLEVGSFRYYNFIDMPSFISAIIHDLKTHNRMWFEIDANRRSYYYFDQPTDWNKIQNPLSDE